MERHTYNTDKFSDEFKEEIVNLWKKDPSVEITVKGTAKKDFVKWISENYPNAVEENGYYSLKNN